jgi:septum site-determining protein MinC
MGNSVIIKGNKYGIIVVLSPDLPFEKLKLVVAEKFKESSKFLRMPRWLSALKEEF